MCLYTARFYVAVMVNSNYIFPCIFPYDVTSLLFVGEADTLCYVDT